MGLTSHECSIQARKNKMFEFWNASCEAGLCLLEVPTQQVQLSLCFLAGRGCLGAVCAVPRDGGTWEGLCRQQGRGRGEKEGHEGCHTWKQWGQIWPLRPLHTFLGHFCEGTTPTQQPSPLPDRKNQFNEHQLSRHSTPTVPLPSPFRVLLHGFFKNQPGGDCNTSGYWYSSAQLSRALLRRSLICFQKWAVRHGCFRPCYHKSSPATWAE